MGRLPDGFAGLLQPLLHNNTWKLLALHVETIQSISLQNFMDHLQSLPRPSLPSISSLTTNLPTSLLHPSQRYLQASPSNSCDSLSNYNTQELSLGFTDHLIRYHSQDNLPEPLSRSEMTGRNDKALRSAAVSKRKHDEQHSVGYFKTSQPIGGMTGGVEQLQESLNPLKHSNAVTYSSPKNSQDAGNETFHNFDPDLIDDPAQEPDTEDKRMKRLLKNRLAAKQCRLKKKAYISSLEKQVSHLKQSLVRMETVNGELRRENQRLVKINERLVGFRCN